MGHAKMYLIDLIKNIEIRWGVIGKTIRILQPNMGVGYCILQMPL